MPDQPSRSPSLISALCAGGFYWPVQQNSPGHSLWVENGTSFKVAVEGPASNLFVTGACRDGALVATTGEQKGRAFQTANELVNSVREPSADPHVATCGPAPWPKAITSRPKRRLKRGLTRGADRRNRSLGLAVRR